MSVIETSAIWNDGASLAESGNFQGAVTKFIALQGQNDSCHLAITSGRNLFNIGQMYFALKKLDQAAQCFEAYVEKDHMSAVGHYMLGNVNLALNRNEEALHNFNKAYFVMRENKIINYQPLGLIYRLYSCEILANRAIAHTRLGHIEAAKADFLKAIQSKVEPRHKIIKDFLLCWQAGQDMEPFTVPSHVVYRQKREERIAIESLDQNYLGCAQVIYAHKGAQCAASETMATKREELMKDLRKKESRNSLKRITPRPDLRQSSTLPNRSGGSKSPPSPSTSLSPPQTPMEKSLPASRARKSSTLPNLSGRPKSDHDTATLSPTESPLGRSLPTPRAETRSPVPQDMTLSKPPDKSLPSPTRKSPLPLRRMPSPVPFGIGRDVTVNVQLVLSRPVEVARTASTQELLRAAANTFALPEDSLALCCKRNDQLLALQEKDLERILNSPEDSKETILLMLK